MGTILRYGGNALINKTRFTDFNLKNISTKVIDIKDFNKSFSDGCENYIKDGNKNIQWVMYEYDKREPLNNNAQVTLINFN